MNPLEEFIYQIGDNEFATELDFAGDEPYLAAAKFSKQFDVKFQLVAEDFESENGFPTFRFFGNREQLFGLLEAYGI